MAHDGLLIKLPGEVNSVHAALFGMASVGMRNCRNAGLSMGDRVLVVGVGIIGQIMAQIANAMGARVVVCSTYPNDGPRLDTARRIAAAEEVLDVSRDRWSDLLEPREFDVVFDLVGVPEDRLLQSVRRAGTLVLVAGRERVTYTSNLAQSRRVTIKQSTHFDPDDLAILCRLVARGVVQLGPLIQDVVSVSQADRIYKLLRDEPVGLMGTVFEW